jgi:hypothetical protein
MLEKFNRYKRRQRLTTAELRQKVQILSASTIHSRPYGLRKVSWLVERFA